MATRSNIMITSDWANFASAYCHWDGGLWGVGKVLNKNYNDTDTILDLVSLGAMSSLKETVDLTASDDWNVYSGELPEVEMKPYENIDSPSAGEEMVYVWDTIISKWFYGEYSYEKAIEWKTLEEALEDFDAKNS